MKNTRTFIGVAVVCLVGGFTLMHWVPLLSGKQAKLGNRPTLQGSAYPGEIRAFAGQVCPAGWLAADGSELNPDWLKDAKAVGITAGASAPEVLVDDVIEALRRIGPVKVSVLPGREENIEFRLPAELTAG